MTTIRASCTTCGDVELTVEHMQVRVCETTALGEYEFVCPVCSRSVCRAAEPRILDLLVASGVRLIQWSLPAELLEAHTGSPISYDELAEFNALLGDEEATATALGQIREGLEKH